MDDNPITHIDCFSGPGGICTGFRAAGIRTIAAIEQVKSCVDTYSANHPEVVVLHDDIRNIGPERLLPLVPERGIDIVTSGMPCETFSTAGNTSRSFYDDRQFLFREGIRIARMVNARVILFENVPAITSKKIKKNSRELVVEVLERELEEAGYPMQARFLLNALDYGVPQRRKRFFLLASREKDVKFSLPQTTFKKNVTVAQALSGLPDILPNSSNEGREYRGKCSAYANLMRDESFWKLGRGVTDTVSYQTPMKHRDCTLERFALLKQGENLKDLFDRFIGDKRAELQAKRILPKKWYIQRNYRLVPSEAAPTVTSHCLDEMVHPFKNRALTVRECARLQSFPDCYDFAGGPFIVPHINREVQDKYEQIGDAVPPLLAYAWGRYLKKLLVGDECPLT
ncbi:MULTISPECIES: DNA cytosine methyltransferase [unclassified Desulfovibrio]|uniref:DNA cytosine methyltransferase n=1 Tax=unclassified Desulfovibrio TaxID=2593640 RepID=UPI0013ED78BA|nr:MULTISPECIES: DNA cytosine methyltransferase [unclassified Desulfovibrio]